MSASDYASWLADLLVAAGGFNPPSLAPEAVVTCERLVSGRIVPTVAVYYGDRAYALLVEPLGQRTRPTLEGESHARERIQ